MLFQVRTGQARLCHVGSGYITSLRIGHVMSGKDILGQVSTC
jgi:hypothetical protein